MPRATAMYQCEDCSVLVVGEFDDDRTPLWIGANVHAADYCYPQGEPECDSCSLDRLRTDGVSA